MDYLGVDISKTKFDVCLLTDQKTRLRAFDNDLEGFQALLNWLASHAAAPVHVCMEGTGRLWEPLAEFLTGKVAVVSVVNPACVKGFADSELRRSKSDTIDAKIIARFCRAQTPRAWTPPEPAVKAIRDLQRYIDALKVDCVREGNRLKSGVLTDTVVESIERHLSFLTEEIESLQKRLHQMVASAETVAQDYELVTSIIGVGEVTAITVLGEIASVQKFETARELEVFVGIAPRVFQSGSSVRGRTRISKKGNSRVRKALYMAALAAMRHNPILRSFADRLRQSHKPGKVIVCAVMRKLLRVMFAILKSRQPFDLLHISLPPAQA